MLETENNVTIIQIIATVMVIGFCRYHRYQYKNKAKKNHQHPVHIVKTIYYNF